MDKLSKINTYSMLLITCLVISTGCLGASYMLAGYWQILLAFSLLLILWLLNYKQSKYLSASVFLSGYVILAAVGIMLDFSVSLMIVACVFALVSWDLLQFVQSDAGNLLDTSIMSREKYHLNSLALAASLGLIMALISANINLRIPFVVIVFLALIATGCFIYGVQFVARRKS